MKPEEYLEKVKDVAERLKKQSSEINQVISLLKEIKTGGGRVFLIGNGGSAGAATHTACDLFKLGNLQAQSLCENPCLLTALINDDGWDKIYTSQLSQLMQPGDALIAFSVHGGSGSGKAGLWSQNLLAAIGLA